MNEADIARRALALMDLTELGDTAGEKDVAALCDKAGGNETLPPIAAICLWPRHVAFARRRWQGRIATVVNFPGGDEGIDAVVGQTRDALAAGADEIDIVLPHRAFLAGDAAPAAAMLHAIRAETRGKTLKVILESGLYPDEATIAAASGLAITTGADFIKTSTGKVPVGATLDAARVMLRAIRAAHRPVGFKPSGGIRTLEDARTYLDLADSIMGPEWARPATFRFGASGLYGALAGAITGAASTASTGY